MKAPPKLPSNPRRMIVQAILGVAWMALGLFSEFATLPHPVVPIQDAFGILIVAGGAGCGTAVLARYFPKAGRFPILAVALVMFYWQTAAHTSAMPMCLAVSIYYFISVVLQVADFEES